MAQLVEQSSRGVGVEFRLHSPDGEEGYPGNLDVSVSFIVSPDNYLHIIYTGVTDKVLECRVYASYECGNAGNSMQPHKPRTTHDSIRSLGNL